MAGGVVGAVCERHGDGDNARTTLPEGRLRRVAIDCDVDLHGAGVCDRSCFSETCVRPESRGGRVALTPRTEQRCACVKASLWTSVTRILQGSGGDAMSRSARNEQAPVGDRADAGRRGRAIYVIVAAVLAAATVALVLDNRHDVTLGWLFGEGELPVAVALVVAALLGSSRLARSSPAMRSSTVPVARSPRIVRGRTGGWRMDALVPRLFPTRAIASP